MKKILNPQLEIKKVSSYFNSKKKNDLHYIRKGNCEKYYFGLSYIITYIINLPGGINKTLIT